MRRALLTLAFWAAGTCALADVQPTKCAVQSHKGAEYTFYTVNDPSVLRLHLKGDDGEVIGSFRHLEAIQTPNALYFDGRISKLHAPSLGRSDIGQQMGPVISASH